VLSTVSTMYMYSVRTIFHVVTAFWQLLNKRICYVMLASYLGNCVSLCGCELMNKINKTNKEVADFNLPVVQPAAKCKHRRVIICSHCDARATARRAMSRRRLTSAR